MVDTTDSRRGCWTCKARKVHCDRQLPNCQKCIQNSRRCEGYEDRLSWPKTNDSKRALTASPTKAISEHDITQYSFINSATWEVELHRQLCSSGIVSANTTLPQQLHPFSTPQGRSCSETTWNELVHYFHETAYLSLITFKTPSIDIRDVLLRIISRTDSQSEKGVYLAILAFSSLHRQCYEQAGHLKLLALQTLSTSSRQLTQGTPSLSESICHVAACMLLCAVETLSPSTSSGEWLWYVLGAMSVIHATDSNEAADHADVGVLLDWFYYHYALSRFATRHWNHKTVGALETENGIENISIQHTLVSQQQKSAWQDFPPTHAVLSLLAEACDTLPDSNDTTGNSNSEYDKRLEGLRSRTALLPLHWNSSPNSRLVLKDTAEVYQAATLIYLKHASRGPSELSSSSQWVHANSIDTLVDAVFERHIEVSSECSHFFPLLMIACEARTEERRAAIMRCIGRTDENSAQGRNFERIKVEIERMWVQQDLYADIDLCEDTQRLLSAVISSNSALPSYA